MELSDHRINGKITQSDSLFFRQADSLLKPSITDYIPVSACFINYHYSFNFKCLTFDLKLSFTYAQSRKALPFIIF